MFHTTADILNVYYPDGGRRFLLHWYTDYDRGHVVIAPTTRSLHATGARVFKEHPYAEIKAMCEIEVVAPSKRLAALVAKGVREDNVRHFFVEIAHRLDEAEKAGYVLPTPFVRCTKYEPDDASVESSENDEHDAWVLERHYGCRHCRSRIRLVDLTPEQLHDRYAESWLAQCAERHRTGSLTHGHTRVPTRVPSRAAPAADDAALWFASAEFGHHAKGVVLKEVEYDESGGISTMYFGDRAMFFFKRLRKLNQADMKAMLSASLRAAKALEKDAERLRHEEYAREVREQHETIVRFFSEHGSGGV